MAVKGTEDSAGFRAQHAAYPLALGIGGTEILLTRLAWKVSVVPLMDIKEDCDGCWSAYLVSFCVSFIVLETLVQVLFLLKPEVLVKALKIMSTFEYL